MPRSVKLLSLDDVAGKNVDKLIRNKPLYELRSINEAYTLLPCNLIVLHGKFSEYMANNNVIMLGYLIDENDTELISKLGNYIKTYTVNDNELNNDPTKINRFKRRRII